MVWPSPHRITIGDADLVGDVDEVILPVTIVPQNPGTAIDLTLRAEYGVCKDICILREDHLQHRIAAQPVADPRSEEHTSELQSLMRISYAVFCLKKKTTKE